MKKIISFFLVATLILLAGCTKAVAPINVGGVSDKGASPLVSEELLRKYITNLEVCLTGENELVFDKVDSLSGNTLMMFFLFAINSEEGDKAGHSWYGKDGKYHIPTSDIEKKLAKYFEDKPEFDPITVSGYDPMLDEVVLPSVSGFGGTRYLKVLSANEINNELTVSVGFYDSEALSKLQYTKTYRLKKGIKNYKYISVTKSYDKSATPVSYIALGRGFVGYTKDKKFYTAGGNEKTEKFANQISTSELLTTQYSVYSSTAPVKNTMLTPELYDAESFLAFKSLDSLRLTKAARESGTLYISGGVNPFPRPVSDLTQTLSEMDTNSVRVVLSQNGASRSPVNITSALSCDADGNGTNETYICANSPRDKMTNLPLGISKKQDGRYFITENAGLYSFILKVDGKKAELIDSKFLHAGEYNYDALLFSTNLLGLYDLNADGKMEVCAEYQLFETMLDEVFSLDGGGTFKQVMYSTFK